MKTLADLIRNERWARMLSEGLHGWEEVARPSGRGRFFEVDDLAPFEPDREAFSASNAYWLSELSRLAYLSDPAERATAVGRAGVEEVRALDQKGCHAILWNLAGRATGPCHVLSIRGTNNLLQWVLDFDFNRAEWADLDDDDGEPVRVHRGFKRVFDLLWPSLRELLEGENEEACPLVLTGHSLGGALANFAAAWVRPRFLYTIGCPRLGNAEFLERLEGIPNFRVFFRDDLVAAWPGVLKPEEREELLHAGQPCRLEHDGGIDFTEDPDAPSKDDFPGMLREMIPEGGILAPPQAILDHSPIRYSDALARALRGQLV